MKDLQIRDLKHIWHPCSQMKDYENFPPIVIERGEGAYLYDYDGNSYLDAVSSWWVNLFGHSNKRLNKAIEKQLADLEHVIFANFSHKPAIELAENVVKYTPAGLEKVFFADNGSSSVEIALKMSYQYHQQVGNTGKNKFLALKNAYHGETLGALSMGDLDSFTQIFKPLLLNTYRAQGPDCFRCPYGQKRESCSAQCFEHMEKMVEEHHEELCAIILEPLIQGAAGMKMYSPVYLKKVREICDRYDIHFIADEIAVGFGRTGKMFACEHAQVSPDLMTVSKGLTSGYLPLALILTTDKIYDAFYSDYAELKAFFHSHSYTGNPVTCAVANETFKIFEEENVLEKNKEKSKLIKDLVEERMVDKPYIGELRQQGMVTAIELVEDQKTKKGFDWKKRVGYQIYQNALKRGVLLRPIGDTIYFIPPYIVNEKDIKLMVDGAFGAMEEYFGK